MPWTKSFLGYRNKFTMGIYLLAPTCLTNSYPTVALVAIIHRWAIEKMLYDCWIFFFLCWLIEKLLCNFIHQRNYLSFKQKMERKKEACVFNIFHWSYFIIMPNFYVDHCWGKTTYCFFVSINSWSWVFIEWL